MKPERIEQLLDGVGHVWFGGQRERVRHALLTVVNEMTQTRRQSLIEVTVNYIIGFCVAMLCMSAVSWFYNLGTSTGQDVSITLFFTVVSLIRSYVVRRFFNWRHGK